MTTKAKKSLSDLVNNTAEKDTKKPTHNLVLSIETESGVRSLGKIGLFTTNNALHEVIAELSANELNQLGDLLHFTVEQFSDSKETTKPKLAFKR